MGTLPVAVTHQHTPLEHHPKESQQMKGRRILSPLLWKLLECGKMSGLPCIFRHSSYPAPSIWYMLHRNVMKERIGRKAAREERMKRGNKASMSSTGYASRAFSIPKGRDRLTVSYKVDKYSSKKVTNDNCRAIWPDNLGTVGLETSQLSCSLGLDANVFRAGRDLEVIQDSSRYMVIWNLTTVT